MVRVRGRNPRLTAAHASPTHPQIPARRGLVALRPDRRRKPFVINIRKTPANLIFRSLCHLLSQRAVKMRQFGATADGRAGTAEGTIFNPEFSNLRSYFVSLRLLGDIYLGISDLEETRMKEGNG